MERAILYRTVSIFGGNTQLPAVRTAVVWSSNFAICKALIGRMAGVSSPHLLFTVMWQPCLCKLSDWITFTSFTTVKWSSYKNVERASHVLRSYQARICWGSSLLFWCQTAHFRCFGWVSDVSACNIAILTGTNVLSERCPLREFSE